MILDSLFLILLIDTYLLHQPSRMLTTPSTYWIIGFTIMILVYYVLNILNVLRLKKNPVPDALKSLVDGDESKKIISYTLAKNRLGLVEYGVDKLILLLALFGGFISWWAGCIDMTTSNTSPLFSALLFYFGIIVFGMLINIPFSLYSSFVIEHKFGFNKQTFGSWISDFFKSLLITIVLGGLFISALLAVLYYSGSYWWMYAWIIIFGIGLSLQALYPVFIAPLFNTFTPLKNEDFVHKIEALFAKAGIKTEGIYKMDASRRSSHSNAYFTGLGTTKRVVLFDTLLSHINEQEILSVLAHEIGHWKRKHALRTMVLTQIVSLFFLYLASLLINNPLLYLFGQIAKPEPYVGLFLLTLVWQPLSFFISPLFAWLSRKFEYEADQYCYQLTKDKESFKSGLGKLYRKNLSNLNPHPCYEAFFYSHPSPVRRFEAMDELS